MGEKSALMINMKRKVEKEMNTVSQASRLTKFLEGGKSVLMENFTFRPNDVLVHLHSSSLLRIKCTLRPMFLCICPKFAYCLPGFLSL